MFLKYLINKNLSGKKVLILLLLTNLVYAFMLIITIPEVMTFSGGLKLPDMMPLGYDLEYINTLFETLGEKGRDVYLFYQLPVDMIYPLLFAISYSLLMVYFLKKLDKLDSVLFYFSWLAIIAGSADYLENIGIAVMLNNYPDITSNSVILTNSFTLIKSITTTLYFLALIMIMISVGIKSIKSKTIREKL